MESLTEILSNFFNSLDTYTVVKEEAKTSSEFSPENYLFIIKDKFTGDNIKVEVSKTK